MREPLFQKRRWDKIQFVPCGGFFKKAERPFPGWPLFLSRLLLLPPPWGVYMHTRAEEGEEMLKSLFPSFFVALPSPQHPMRPGKKGGGKEEEKGEEVF